MPTTEPGAPTARHSCSPACRQALPSAQPPKGGFLIDGQYTVEVGGPNKESSQLKGFANAHLAIDDIEHGSLKRIPLWLFGLLR